MSDQTFVTMKEIGAEMGMTSHQVGKRLKKIGPRADAGRPSEPAFAGDYLSRKFSPSGNHYLWAWNRDKTPRTLEEDGFAAKT